jgi:crotonobetainyl-CoA:carnitine CoA-transferase CaiB-like acyl-CoA transferase
VQVSLFGSAAELMAVPYLQARYGEKAPERVGLKHPSIAPYGSFTCSDGREIVLSIQNEREWASFCAVVLGDASLAIDPRFCDNAARVRHRAELEAIIQAAFDPLTHAEVADRLTEAQTAFGAINSVHDLIKHPQLRTKPMTVNGRRAEIPAAPYTVEWEDAEFPPAPMLGERG